MLAERLSSRNPLFLGVFRDYGCVDASGMGVRTKTVPLLKQFTGPLSDLGPTEARLLVQVNTVLSSSERG